MPLDLPPEQLATLRTVLDALERDFRPLADTLTPDSPSALVFPCEPEGE
jgi:hypothetical protein